MMSDNEAGFSSYLVSWHCGDTRFPPDRDDSMFAVLSSVIQHRALIGVFLHRCLCCCNEPTSPHGLLKFHLISPFSITGLPIRDTKIERERESFGLRIASRRSYSFKPVAFQRTVLLRYLEKHYIIPLSWICPLCLACLCAALCVCVKIRQIGFWYEYKYEC